MHPCGRGERHNTPARKPRAHGTDPDGAIFLLAGIPKVINPDQFYWDVVPYTFLFGFDEQTSALVARSALSLGPIECVLGVALVAN